MLSVILPIYNEEQGISVFLADLEGVLTTVNTAYEVIMVNDGSTDGTFDILRTFCTKNSAFKYINLSRNFGHQVAITAGIDHAQGDQIVLMDSDGQDPPQEIAALKFKLEEGFDMVYAKRRTRENESWLKKFTAKIFYKLLNRITTTDIPLDTGDFRIFNRKVANALKQMPEKQRFLRGQLAWLGFKQTYILYERKGRFEGETHYTYRKMMRLAMDAITSFSNWPLRVATISGFVCSFIGFLLILYTLYSRFITGDYEPGWPSLMITIVFLGGIQLMTIGIIGEYISRINENVKNRPMYLIQETNIDDAHH